MAEDSSENLELVRSIYERWERGDFSDTDWAAPEIEFELWDGLSLEAARGIEGMTKVWTNFLRQWEGFTAKLEDLRVIDENRILALLVNTGQGKASGMAVADVRGYQGANLFTITGGRVTHLLADFGREMVFSRLGLDP